MQIDKVAKSEVTLRAGKSSVPVGLIGTKYNIGKTSAGNQYVNIYDERTIDFIAELARQRVRHKFDCPILISGARRTGKTTNAVAIARRQDPNFTTDRIAFRLEDFEKILQELPKADPDRNIFPVAILDESGVDLYSKDWMQRSVKSMSKIFQIMGAKNLTTILCLPHKNFLSRDIRESMFLWLYTTTLDYERGFCELREAVENKWSVEVYWKPLCAFCFEPTIDDFWCEYEIKKMKFINDFISEVSSTKEATPTKSVAQRNALLQKYCTKVPLAELSDITGMNQTQLSRIRVKTDAIDKKSNQV